MTDFFLVAWVSAMIEAPEIWLDVWAGNALDAWRKTESCSLRVTTALEIPAAMYACRKRCGSFVTFLARRTSTSA